MNTLQLIKSRTIKTRAIDQARLQMARAFDHPVHIDRTHTPLQHTTKQSQLCYRGVTYEPPTTNQNAKGGRDLRYRGVTYGVY